MALWAVVQEVERRTHNRGVILLVLSDGQPHTHGYTGEAAVAHTRAIVKRLQRDMAVLQVAIEPELDSARMFDHYVRFTELATLPADMMRLVCKLLT